MSHPKFDRSKLKDLLIIGCFSSQIVGCTTLKNTVNLPPTLAQNSPQSNVQEIVQSGTVRSLPGQLDQIPLFSSNSPEWIKNEGILLSTFPPTGKTTPKAHLNFPLQGKFNIFAHHFTHTPKNLQTLYIGILVHNPNRQAVTINIPQAASYLMEPDAPFQNKSPMLDNPDGKIFSGPGIRAVDTVLRGQRQADFPAQLIIPPQSSRMLLNHPIPVRGLARPVNGRSTLIRLHSSGQVYVASLAMFEKTTTTTTTTASPTTTTTRPPTLAEWENLLNTGNLAGPRDKTPTPPEQTSGALVYSRVAGVQAGSGWITKLVDRNSNFLNIPARGQAISYALSTLRGGRLGTGQIQAAKLLVRYPDTAYESHGNYAVHYDLTLPLKNATDQTQTVTLTLATPLKEDVLSKSGLRFRTPPLDFPYFRGTIRLREVRAKGETSTRYIHLWHRVGQQLEPLATYSLAPGQSQQVRVDFFYPPDATPPQVFTIRTIEPYSIKTP